MCVIAVLADSHLPDADDTVKERVFDWALAQLAALQPDLLIAAGDLTAMGSIAASHRVREKLNATGIPLLITPGNAEYRNPAETAAVLRILHTSQQVHLSGVLVVGLDNGTGALSHESREILAQCESNKVPHLLLAMHLPQEDMCGDDRAMIERLMADGVVECLVCGHSHRDRCYSHTECVCHEVRGLDPDKAIGGPPAFILFRQDTSLNAWQREDVVCLEGCPTQWAEKTRQAFLSLLGVSCMEDTLEGLALATSHGIPCVEIRFEPSRGLDISTLKHAIWDWRAQGGKTLSMHFPDLSWDAAAQKVIGLDELEAACDLVAALGVNTITWHVPRASVSEVCNNTHTQNALLTAADSIIKQLRIFQCRVAIENLHMNPWEKADDARGFGYTPEECRFWLEALRRVSGYDQIGLLLDVGHARNNAPYSSMYNLSQWYALLGNQIYGYHLHQVGGDAGNHQPITSLYGPLISFSAFFMAWEQEQINHAPMFLEVRNTSFMPTFQYVRDFVAG